MQLTVQNKTLNIELSNNNGLSIAEISSDELLINEVTASVELLIDLYYQNFDVIIFHEKNITPDFFNLSSGMAGEILQKVSNFRMRLAIIGDYSNYTSNSLKDFIFESNKLGKIIFVNSVEEAKERFAKS